MILIVIGALATIKKGLIRCLDELEIGEKTETLETAASLRATRILRKVLETFRDLLSFTQMKDHQLSLL